MFGRRKNGKRGFRLFFATDVHGSDRCFRKFLAAASVYKANALILGGDIAGKAVVPLVQNGNGRYRVRFQGEEREVSREELGAIEERIKFNGFYPYICDAEEHERVSEESAYQESLFERLIMEQISDWRRLVEERLSPDVRCIITPGNDDPWAIDSALGAPGRVECPEREAVRVGPIVLASLGNTNHTPWDTDREFDEEELARQIDEMLSADTNGAPLVFNFHCPPYKSGLDTVVKLDENLRPVIERGAPVEVPVGSKAVRDAIDRYSPVVGLHGHIHESHGVQRIGSTVCINPGSDYGSGVLKGAIVDFDQDGHHISHLLTSG